MVIELCDQILCGNDYSNKNIVSLPKDFMSKYFSIKRTQICVLSTFEDKLNQTIGCQFLKKG